MPTKRSSSSIPTTESMLLPTIQALQSLGGSGTVEEIYDRVVELLNLPDQVLEIPQGNTSQSKVEYRLGWSRTHLKKYGLLQNSARGVWSLASTAIDLDNLDTKEIIKAFRKGGNNKATPLDLPDDTIEAIEPLQELSWHQQLHKTLLSLEPAAFERLAQRLLRESGFVQVQVTGKSGDGGIDGVGIARISGFLSFHVLFQCKRW